ncbi:MAG TPA: hypothetical protein VFS40_00915 [Gemmatimonadales bacterium]|nr:hypothetical protein [Gemmatimonadales bacterium]
MVATIRIDQLLQEAVTSPYRMLVTRPTGAAVRGRIQAALDGSECETALLDFSAIELIDLSCADEVVVKLLATDTMARRYVVLRGLCDNQREAIDHVLAQQRLAVAALLPETDRPALLGWATDDLRRAFDAVCATAGPVVVSALAAMLEWPVARAADALATLARHRVVRAAADGYRPLSLPLL